LDEKKAPVGENIVMGDEIDICVPRSEDVAS
jgi:hypothetical protein